MLKILHRSGNLYKTSEAKYTQFTHLDEKGKYIYMLSAGVDVAELVGKFTYMVTCVSLAYTVRRWYINVLNLI